MHISDGPRTEARGGLRCLPHRNSTIAASDGVKRFVFPREFVEAYPQTPGMDGSAFGPPDVVTFRSPPSLTEAAAGGDGGRSYLHGGILCAYFIIPGRES